MSTNFIRTFHSPMNNSSSKQMYGFPKAERFQPSRRSQCKRQFYETTRGALTKRSTSFGYGYKATFENREGVPQPSKYSGQNEFEKNIVKKRGYSFGKDDNRNLLSNPKQLRRFPGPGNYLDINEKHKTGYGSSFANIKFSMRGKYEDPLSRHVNQLGPGQYAITSPISARGQYFDSKYQNSFARRLGNDTRFKPEKVESPGPGAYKGNQQVNINGTGTYFDTKFKTTKASSFSRQNRPSPAKPNEAPDPGAYSTFSEFALQNKTWSKQY